MLYGEYWVLKLYTNGVKGILLEEDNTFLLMSYLIPPPPLPQLFQIILVASFLVLLIPT
jgi:hypothetical protein